MTHSYCPSARIKFLSWSPPAGVESGEGWDYFGSVAEYRVRAAMDAWTFFYALLLAIAATAALIVVPSILEYFLTRRLFMRFAQLQCASCHSPVGLEAVRSGKDVSPFEEVWGDGTDHFSYCQPTCRVVSCPRCKHNWILRYNGQGSQFGPEMSVTEADIDV